jgi:hypothetical protein
MGDIGKEAKPVIFEPIEAPAPVDTPVPAEPVEVPA